MKIIQVSAYYPPHLGGQENAVQDLAKQLARSGHEVYVLTSTMGGGPPGLSEEHGLKVIRLKGWEFGHTAIMPEFVSQLSKLVTPDCIVHIHVGQAFTPEMVWIASRLYNFKYIAELHIDFEPSGRAGFLLPFYKKFILCRVLKDAAQVAVLNKKTKSIVRDFYGVPNRTVIVNNGIDDIYFSLSRQSAMAPPNQLRLLSVGRLSKQKNIDSLLRAVALSNHAVHLDIVGDGDQHDYLLGLARDLKINDFVTFHGRVNRSDVLAFYETCDALVMPSHYEAQPLVLLEAMAARIPIIGSNVIGVAEHLEDIGILVEPNPQSIAEGFDKFYEQYGTLGNMVGEGFVKAQKLRWRNLRKEYESLYHKVLAQ